MQIVQLKAHRYKLATRLDALTGDVQRHIDPELLSPPAEDKPPDLAEFEMGVIVGGFPLLSIPQPQTGDAAPSMEDPARSYILARFEQLRPSLEDRLRADVARLIERRVGREGWLIQRVSVEAGSLTLTAVIIAGFGLLMKYKTLRENVVLAHGDLTAYAIPFARQVWQDLFQLEMFPRREAAMSPARPSVVAMRTPEGEGKGSRDLDRPADLRTLLREIVRDELRLAMQEGGESGVGERIRRAAEVEATLRGGAGLGLDPRHPGFGRDEPIEPAERPKI